ncbi:MAG: FecR domain-containing protein, partial [Cyclobacteriaceae bacterium]|nr:FecR domain-containing protein [Cyclobacteriaceae bacterium]
MDRINYLNYTVTDFVFDESFREWVLKNNPKKDEFWDNWIARNPGKLKDIQKARELIQAMNEELKEDFSEESARMWRIIDSEIDQLEEKSGLAERNMILHKKQLEQKGKSRSRRRRLAVIGIAASIALLFVTGMYFFNQKGMTIYQTGYGETRRVTLPDNSVVTLNANTILRVPNNWEQLETRKVWIEGEAFFSIVPKGDRQKFLVHSRNVTVDVLGTKFNVNNRREKNQVTLTSGRIELSIKSG